MYLSQLQATGDCQPCAADVTGESCLQCNGSAAAAPLAPGFTVPSLAAAGAATDTSGDATRRLRRSLRAVAGRSHVHVPVLRCHSDLDIAKLRCPNEPRRLNTSQRCAEGHRGLLCGSCVEGWGMALGGKRCELCFDMDAGLATWQTLLQLGMLLLLGVLCSAVFFKYWDEFNLKYYMRILAETGRIVFTYAQVTSQLDSVLNMRYPGMFGKLLDAMRPVMELWTVAFQVFGPLDCLGLRGFASTWLLRVVGAPVFFAVVIALVYVHARRTKGVAAAGERAKRFAMVATYLIYPTVCVAAFSTFICKRVDEHNSVLDADDTVLCEPPTAEFKLLKVASLAVIFVFALGTPALFIYVLHRATRGHEATQETVSGHAVTQQIAQQNGVSLDRASMVVREVLIGRNYS